MPTFATHEFFATCLPGVEALLADELQALKVRRTRPLKGGVAFYGEAVDGLRVCLWSRLAGRVTVVLGRVEAADAAMLYEGVRALPWESILASGASVAVRATGVNDELRNTQFTALKVKDALCDRMAETGDARPDVDTQHPDATIEVRLRDAKATISLDLSGGSLHRRPYLAGRSGEEAPVTVAQAAALLAALDAASLLRYGGGLLDPACDNGVLVTEAASLAADQAPNLLRESWGFRGWAAASTEQWDDLLDEADERFEAGLAKLLGAEDASSRSDESEAAETRGDAVASHAQVRIVGLSASSPAVARARDQVKAAGLRSVVSIEAATGGEAAVVEERLAAVLGASPLLVAQVAAAGRASDDARAVAEQAACVAAARRAPEGSRFGFAGSGDFAARFGCAPVKSLVIGRGRSETTIECFDEAPVEPAVITVPNPQGGTELAIEVNEAGAAQFAARLRKVARERRKWAQREGVHCYRIYDADLPEYAAAIDLYEGAGDAQGITYAHVAEYQAPKSVDEAKARARFEDILAIVPVVLGIRPDHVFSKARLRARGGGQYRDAGGRSYVTHTTESSLRFEVDLGGYLDTGLFLDHRTTREMVGRMAQGKSFLNLFAYTGTATVRAAAGGARSTTTVDLSGTYLDWAARNLEANGFVAVYADEEGGRREGRAARGPQRSLKSSQHQLVRADVTRWIQEARRTGKRYDLIFVDPPTFSNSKSMGKRTWDVQRDHVELLIGVSRLLTADGEAIFSCNLRSFKPDTEALERYGVEIEDITASTIPHDFERNPRIHHCYRVHKAREAR